MEYFLVVGIAAIAGGFLGAWIAGQKGRDRTEGFLLGFFLLAIGWVIEGLLPAAPTAVVRPLPSRDAAAKSAGPYFQMVGEKDQARKSKPQKSFLNLK